MEFDSQPGTMSSLPDPLNYASMTNEVRRWYHSNPPEDRAIRLLHVDVDGLGSSGVYYDAFGPEQHGNAIRAIDDYLRSLDGSSAHVFGRWDQPDQWLLAAHNDSLAERVLAEIRRLEISTLPDKAPKMREGKLIDPVHVTAHAGQILVPYRKDLTIAEYSVILGKLDNATWQTREESAAHPNKRIFVVHFDPRAA